MPQKRPGDSTKVCIECIGQCTGFACFSRTRERVRLTQTKPAHCPLQFTQHSLCESPGLFCGISWERKACNTQTHIIIANPGSVGWRRDIVSFGWTFVPGATRGRT